MKRVLITGAEGLIGTILRRHLSRQYDLLLLTREPIDVPSHVAGIANLEQITPAFEGCDAVVHLAAASSVASSWEDVLHSNIIGTRNVFEAARLSGVGPIVFASSNHVVGMYELEAAPALYSRPGTLLLNEHADPRPDSLYGVSKGYGELLARYYVESFGMKAFCLRIGTVLEDDDPTAHEDGGLLTKERLARTWLSHRDCVQLVSRCLDVEDLNWAILYGVSSNPGRFWDIGPARELVGYEPADSSANRLDS